MPMLDFFAARSDQISLIDFLLASGLRIFESYSESECDLQEFRSTEELDKAFPIGADPHGNGVSTLLQLWSSTVMKRVSTVRINLDPKKCKGHTFRYRIEGAGCMQLYLGGVHGNVITKSHFGHFSERGAGRWSIAGGVDWNALKKISNKIQYHLRHRLAAAKVPGRPVLPEAYRLAIAGYELKEAVQTPWKYELTPITNEK